MKVALWKDPLAEVETHKLSEAYPDQPLASDIEFDVLRQGHPDVRRHILSIKRRSPELAEKLKSKNLSTADMTDEEFDLLVSVLLATLADVRGVPVRDGDAVRHVNKVEMGDEAVGVLSDLCLGLPGVMPAIFNWSIEKQKAFDAYVGGVAKNSSPSSRESAGKDPQKSES